MAEKKTAPPIALNRQAHHNYFIHETYECGIALTGTEVKSIRAGKANLRDSFARIQKGVLTVVADSAETPQQIDRNRAEEAKRRAQDRLSAANRDVNYDRARLALLRAIHRINLIES